MEFQDRTLRGDRPRLVGRSEKIRSIREEAASFCLVDTKIQISQPFCGWGQHVM